ncbi:hypothetical protein U9M48_009724 [Paspalum notatum var. saurae]|uniref:Uncharacterized protein n=1 Tax=Paspalum notatum var. saurae TaxID=547442 RepID=A0AAQ3WFE2_PASNO
MQTHSPPLLINRSAQLASATPPPRGSSSPTTTTTTPIPLRRDGGFLPPPPTRATAAELAVVDEDEALERWPRRLFHYRCSRAPSSSPRSCAPAARHRPAPRTSRPSRPPSARARSSCSAARASSSSWAVAVPHPVPGAGGVQVEASALRVRSNKLLWADGVNATAAGFGFTVPPRVVPAPFARRVAIVCPAVM